MTRLEMATTYYVRAYASNNAGTAYGGEVEFTTDPVLFNPDIEYGSVSDIEGNVYKTILAGTQTWMAENLRTVILNDGSEIPYDRNWIYSGITGYCWYNNDESLYKVIYGAIYNVKLVRAANLCPAGWHVPGQSEWNTMVAYLGGEDIAGGKMKEAGTVHWESPNQGATNESGFSALPGGMRYANFSPCSPFSVPGLSGYWGSYDDWPIEIYHDRPEINNSLNAGYWDKPGFYVRCVKDP